MKGSKPFALPLGYTPLLSLFYKIGEPAEIRTPDTRLRRPLLYPAELRAHTKFEKWSRWRESNPRHQLGRLRYYHYTTSAYWSGRRDSNSRPSPWQGDALPLSHFRKIGRGRWIRTIVSSANGFTVRPL